MAADEAVDDEREAARVRIKARREFWGLVVVLVGVGLFLIVVWSITSGLHSYFWPVWPLAAFALAIVLRGVSAYGLINRRVTEADVDAELARSKRR